MSRSRTDPARGFVLRPYREGDEAAINEGFNAVFGLDRSLEEWRWKFPAAPEGRWIWVAATPVDTGNTAVVAHFAALPVRVQVEGRRLRVGQVVDVYSRRHAGLALQGVFVRLARSFFADYGRPDRLALVYGFPGDRHFRLGVRALGYSPPVPVPYWWRELAPLTRHRREPRRWLPWGRLTVRPGWVPAAVDELWRRAAPRYPVAVVRDAAWLERRFHHRPGVVYEHLGAWRRGRLEALAVVRSTPGALAWCELVWDGRDPGALALLDREVDRLAVAGEAREPAGRVELWLGGDPEAEAILASRGWLRAEHPQRLARGAVSFHPEIDSDRFCRGLYVTMGDGDLV